MPSVVVLNQLGAEVGKINLKNEVFGIEPNMQVVYDVVNADVVVVDDNFGVRITEVLTRAEIINSF